MSRTSHSPEFQSDSARRDHACMCRRSTQIKSTQTELLSFATGQLPANKPLTAAIWRTLTLHGMCDRPPTLRGTRKQRPITSVTGNRLNALRIKTNPTSPHPLDAIYWSCAQPSGHTIYPPYYSPTPECSQTRWMNCRPYRKATKWTLLQSLRRSCPQRWIWADRVAQVSDILYFIII